MASWIKSSLSKKFLQYFLDSTNILNTVPGTVPVLVPETAHIFQPVSKNRIVLFKILVLIYTTVGSGAGAVPALGLLALY